MIRIDELLPIGKISKAHGIHGEVELLWHDAAYADLLLTQVFLRIDGLFVPFTVDEQRGKSHVSDLLKLHFVDTQADTACIKDSPVYVLRDSLNDTEDDAHQPTLASFIGMEVYEAQHGHIGTITAIDTSSLNTLITVQTPQEHTLDLPLHEDLITDIDWGARRLTLVLPTGLLTL